MRYFRGSMGTRVTFLGPPILQVGGEKFLTRNEVMRSLLGHLGRDRFPSFRGFKVPLVCGKGSTQRSCSTETGCTSTDTPCFFRKVTKAAVDSVRPCICTCICTCTWTPPLAPPCAGRTTPPLRCRRVQNFVALLVPTLIQARRARTSF